MTIFVDVTESTVFPLGTTDGVGTMEPDGVASSAAVGVPAVAYVMSPSGLDASGPGAGSPALQATVEPSGVAPGGDVGVPTSVASVDVVGVPSGLAIGHPEAFTSMSPVGIDAEGGGAGTATTNAIIEPDSIASGLQFGDIETIKTMFVSPIPAPPGNRFGNPTATVKRLIFRPPTQTLGWGWYKRFEGISLIKKDGVWSEVPWPTVDETIEADIYLAGGRDHAVSTSLAAELIAEGYTISEEF
jgi:hypothetical protein